MGNKIKSLKSSLASSNDDDLPRKKTVATTKKGEEVFNLEDKFSISIKLKQNTIQLNSAAATTLPLLVTLNVDSIKTSNKASIDLICVIDHSGSMQGVKLQLVKDTFKYLLELLDENDRLSIIIFDDKVSKLTTLLRMTNSNKSKTLNAINTIQASGGTDIDIGMRAAFETIKQRMTPNDVTSVLLLSDGLDGGAQQKVKATLDSLKLKDTFTINTFGYGSDHDPKLMSDIAQLKDGSFYFVEKLETVDECFVDCLGGLISVVAQDVNIVVKAEPSDIFPGIQITKAYGIEGTWKKIDNAYCTRISQLISGKKKNFVLELQIPKTDKELADNLKNIKIASAVCSVKDVKTGKKVVKKAELVPLFLNEVEEVKDNEVNVDVMFNYYRVKGAEVMNEARSLSDQKKYDDAKKILQNIKEEISNSKLKDDEMIKNLIKDLGDAINNVKPEVYENVGKHYMLQDYANQMEERSNLKSNIQYSNSIQSEMVSKAKSRKIF